MDIDLRTLGASLALVALAAAGLALHGRGWRGDALAFETGDVPRPYAVRRRARWLRLGALACLAVAAGAPSLRAARPAEGVEPTLAIVLDVSMSMRADDVAPSRLDEAKRQLAEGLDARFGGRLALVAFAATPTLVCPPTTDRQAFTDLLAATDETAAVAGPSHAAPAVARAVALVGNGGGDVWLVSDGEFPDEDRQYLQELARVARGRGVRISTLAVGTSAGAPVPVRGGEAGRVQTDRAGQPLVTRVDAAVLQWLAREGEGRFLELTPGGGLDVVTLTERLRLGTAPAWRLFPFGPASLFGYPLALGAALLTVDAWIAWRRRRR